MGGQNKSGKSEEEKPKLWLLEFDRRFEVFKGEFVFYDFNEPYGLPGKYLFLNQIG